MVPHDAVKGLFTVGVQEVNDGDTGIVPNFFD